MKNNKKRTKIITSHGKKITCDIKERVDYMNIYDDTLDFLISETRDMNRKCFGYLYCDKKGIISEYSANGRPLVTVEKSTQYAKQVHLTKKLNTVGSPF